MDPAEAGPEEVGTKGARSQGRHPTRGGDAPRALALLRTSLKCLHPGLETWTEVDTAARNLRLHGRCLLCRVPKRRPGERGHRMRCEYLKNAQETPLQAEMWGGNYVPQDFTPLG